MTSFMQTMFVNPSSSLTPPHSPLKHHFPCAAKALSPLHSNVFAASTSSLNGVALPDPPQATFESPLRKHFQDVLQTSASSASLFSGDSRPGSSSSACTSLLSASPTRREKMMLPRSKAGRAHRRAVLVEEEDEDRGLGSGLEFIIAQADLLTNCDSNANARTRSAFRPQKAQKGTNSWQLKQFAEATLGSGSLKKVVKLPEGEDRDEWLAVNIVDFYNQINLLYGAITEFCSPQSCPEMKATDEFEYLWHNPPDFAKPTRLPAPTYISHLLSWTSAHLSDPKLFPTQPGVPFPANFLSTIRQIFKRLYRVYAHIYCHHYSVIRGLGLEAHLNTGFKHYVLFVEEFGLADSGEGRREWFGPLGELVDSMIRSD
ncbi:hypothetical protein CAC42_4860 [Sphaceloma murrayae]|uniref:Maintenance of ploidy protein mob1 n=1 Tax=Sphaceloma murrayae TaxID=2082308 RepID=A0A2K1QP64_9PEZI|nr:hypothetical protein CAC42_4860 [Sphaceloma murrayae]